MPTDQGPTLTLTRIDANLELIDDAIQAVLLGQRVTFTAGNGCTQSYSVANLDQLQKLYDWYLRRRRRCTRTRPVVGTVNFVDRDRRYDRRRL